MNKRFHSEILDISAVNTLASFDIIENKLSCHPLIVKAICMFSSAEFMD
jgi:hypothetical protein